MSEIRFEPPPGFARNGKAWSLDHSGIVATLRARPGEWAIVATYSAPGTASSMATSIKSGRLAVYRPGGSFEAITRKVDGEVRVYARFVGEAAGS